MSRTSIGRITCSDKEFDLTVLSKNGSSTPDQEV